MANNQIRLFVLFLQRRLEPPHLDYPSAAECSRPDVSLLDVLSGVEIGVAALDRDGRVAFLAEDVHHSVREYPLDQRVEARRADRHESPHACISLRGGSRGYWPCIHRNLYLYCDTRRRRRTRSGAFFQRFCVVPSHKVQRHRGVTF